MEKLEANHIHRKIQKSKVEDAQRLESKGQVVTIDKPGKHDEVPYPNVNPKLPPKKMVEVPERYVALSDNGNTFDADANFVIKEFGKRYYNEVTMGVQKGGFCTVPVGDYKESTLFQSYPELCCAIAPKITYQQSEGMDMCAFKSLASVVHALGWSCLLYTSPSPRDLSTSRMPSSA